MTVRVGVGVIHAVTRWWDNRISWLRYAILFSHKEQGAGRSGTPEWRECSPSNPPTPNNNLRKNEARFTKGSPP